MPVVRAEPPVMAAEVAGAVVERDLLDALFTGRAQLSDRLEQHMSPPLPTIGAGEPLATAMDAFAAADAALVLVDGKPAGVVTRSDVLAFLAPRTASEHRRRCRAAGSRHSAIHAGQEPDPTHRRGDRADPPDVDLRPGRRRRDCGTAATSTRAASNPTRTALEECLAALEGGRHGLAFGSGMAATDVLLRVLLAPGDHIVIPHDAYGGTFRLVDKVLAPWGVRVHRRSTSADLDALRARAAARTTRVVWCETPTNPLLGIADIAAVADVARDGRRPARRRQHASPRRTCRPPLALGADVVLHSTTKYLGGHSDVVGGALVTATTQLAEQLRVHAERRRRRCPARSTPG